MSRVTWTIIQVGPKYKKIVEIQFFILFPNLGGFDELLKGAGKDATNMFNKVHKWVNYESMLKVNND
jgi:hypothetical protein